MTRLFAALSALLLCASLAQAEEFEFLGEYRLPTGLSIAGVEFGGLSAIDYDPETGTFFALSDDRGRRGPPRFYELRLALSAEGIAGVDVLGFTALKSGGTVYAENEVDPEALRLGAPGGGFYWAHEGDLLDRPLVGIIGRDGAAVRAFALPASHSPNADKTAGPRRNLSFESLAVTETQIVSAHENALRQDGPEADVGAPSPSRVLVFDRASGEVAAEYVYEADAVAEAPVPADGFRSGGLVELLTRPEGGFYALERSFSVGRGTTVTLYRTGFGGATAVTGAQSLKGVDYAPMPKERVLSLPADLPIDAVDNLEGMTFGPEIDGARTLVMVSDNNFNPKGQFTQFLLFRIRD